MISVSSFGSPPRCCNPASVTWGAGEAQDLEFCQPRQPLQSQVRDLGAVEDEGSELRQPWKMLEPRVGDPGGGRHAVARGMA